MERWTKGPEWDEMKELQPDYHTAHTFSTGFWEHLFLTEKNPKQTTTNSGCIVRWGKKSPLENIQVLIFRTNLIILSGIIDVDSNCKVNLERLRV